MINIGELHRSKQMISTAKKPSNRKEAVHYLKEIDSGKLHHYYFLPQAAYLDNEIKSKGLIVDLLEIESLTLKDAQKIANPLAEGILYQDLPPLPHTDGSRDASMESSENASIFKTQECL